MEWIEGNKDFELLELTEEILNEDGSSAKHDWVLVLKRK